MKGYLLLVKYEKVYYKLLCQKTDTLPPRNSIGEIGENSLLPESEVIK